MATFRKRNSRWQAQVRLAGQPPRTRTFASRAEAVAWARAEEAQRAEPQTEYAPRIEAARVLMATLFDRYLRTVTPIKRGAGAESGRLRAFMRSTLGDRYVHEVTAGDIAQYRDERLGRVCADTVRRELAILRQVFTIAVREWGVRVRRQSCRRNQTSAACARPYQALEPS